MNPLVKAEDKLREVIKEMISKHRKYCELCGDKFSEDGSDNVVHRDHLHIILEMLKIRDQKGSSK